ncbi:DUF445 domain-containing protein [Persephonella sp.]
MESILQYLVPPLIGAFIGYITNYLAVKMLFRPFEEKRVFGFRIPFTPGLIPKRRKDIALSIAETVEEHLLNEKKLRQLFEESGYKKKLKNRIEIILDQMIEEVLNDLKEKIKEGISIGKLNIKTAVIAVAVEKLIDKTSSGIKSKIKNRLIEKTSDSIEKNIEEELPLILSQLDIKNMVFETLMEMDIQTLEEIVLGFSQKQLKHITYTGAVLGFIIGALESLYMFLIS